MNKQDYIDLLEEIKAYRELDGQSFDFGTGLIKNDMSYGSEDAYYEMQIQDLEEILGYWNYNKPNKSKVKNQHKQKIHKYYKKKIDNQKLNKLHELTWWAVGTRKDGSKYRCYVSNRKKYCKKISNKKVRKYKGLSNGNNYKKIYDLWWEVW